MVEVCVRATHTRQLLVSKLYSYQQPKWLASDGSGRLSRFHKGRVESTDTREGNGDECLKPDVRSQRKTGFYLDSSGLVAVD